MDIDLRREILQVAVRTFADYHSKHKHSANTSNRKSCEEDTEKLRESIIHSSDRGSITQCLFSFTKLRQKHCPHPRNSRIIDWDEVAFIADYLCLLRSHAIEISSTNYDSIPWKCASVIIRRHYPPHEEHPTHLVRAELLLNGTECRNKFDKAIDELGDFCNGKNEIVPCGTLIKSAQQSLEDAAEDLLVQQQLHDEAEAAYRLSLAAGGNRDAVNEDEDEFVSEQLEQGTKAGLEISEAEHIVMRAKDVWNLARMSRHSITQQTVEAEASSDGSRGNNPDAQEPKSPKHGRARPVAASPGDESPLRPNFKPEVIAGNGRRNGGKRERDDGDRDPRKIYKFRVVSHSTKTEPSSHSHRRKIPRRTREGQTSQRAEGNVEMAVQNPGGPERITAVDEETAGSACPRPVTPDNTATFAPAGNLELEAPVQSHHKKAEVPSKGGHKSGEDDLHGLMVDTRMQSGIVPQNLDGGYIDRVPQERVQPDMPTASGSFVGGFALHSDSEIETTVTPIVPLPDPLEEDPRKARGQATGHNYKLHVHCPEGRGSRTNETQVTDPSDTDRPLGLEGAGTPAMERPIEAANVELIPSSEPRDPAYHQPPASVDEASSGMTPSDVREPLCSNDSSTVADDRMATPDPEDVPAQYKSARRAKSEERSKRDIPGRGHIRQELCKPQFAGISKRGKDRHPAPAEWQQRSGAADAVQSRQQGTDKRGAIAERIAKKLGQHMISEFPIKFLPDDVVGKRHFDGTKRLPIDFGKVVKFSLLGLCDVNETIAHMNMPAILLEFLHDSKQSQEAMDILLATLQNSDFLGYHIELYKTLQPLDDNTLASLPQSAKVILTYFKSHPKSVDQAQIQTAICSKLGIQDFNTEVHDRIGRLFEAEVQSLQNWRTYTARFNQQISDLRAEVETKITAQTNETAALRSQLNDLQTACLNIAVLWGTESAGPVDKAFITQFGVNAREVADRAAAALAMAQDMEAFCDHVPREHWKSKGKPLPHFRSGDFVQNVANIRGQITGWLTGLVDECENLQKRLAEANRNASSAVETMTKVTSRNSIMKELVQHAYPQLNLSAINDIDLFVQASENQIESFHICKTAREELVRGFLSVCNAARDLITGRAGQGLPQLITEQQLMDQGGLTIICNGLHGLLQDYASMESELGSLRRFCEEAERKVTDRVFRLWLPNKQTPLVEWTALYNLVDHYVTLRDGERVLQSKTEDKQRQIDEAEGTIQTLRDRLSRREQLQKSEPVLIPGKLLPVNPHATFRPSLAPSASSKDNVLQKHRDFAEQLLCLKNHAESKHRIDLIKKYLSNDKAEEEEYYLVILSLILDKKIEQSVLPPSTRQVLAPLLSPDFDPRSNGHQSRLYKMCAPWYMSNGPLPENWETFQKRVRLEEAGGGNDNALAFVIRNFRTIVRDEIGSFLCYELCTLLMDQTEFTTLQSNLTQSNNKLCSLVAENNALHAVRRAVLESYPSLKIAYKSAVENVDQLPILEKCCKTDIQASLGTRETFFRFYNDVYCMIATTKFLEADSEDVHEQYFLENMKTLSSRLLSSLNNLKSAYTTSQTTLEEVNRKLLSSHEELETSLHIKNNEENRVKALEADVLRLNNEIEGHIDKEGIDRETIEANHSEKQRLTEEIQELQEKVACLTKTKKEQETFYKEQLKERVLKSQLDKVETLKQTADARGELLAAELEVVKTAQKEAGLALADLQIKNMTAAKRTKALEDELVVLKSQNEQLLENQRAGALHREQRERTMRAELTEGQKRCKLLEDELQRFRNGGYHLSRDETRSGGVRGGVSPQTLAKEQQRAIFATDKMRKRSHTVPGSGRGGHSHYIETAQACPSAQRSAASEANSAKLAKTEEKLEAHARLLRETNEKKSLLEGDLEQLTLMIRELDSSINGENSQALPANKCMTKLLQQVQRIRRVVASSNEPNCDVAQGIENLGMQLRDYKDGVEIFEQVLRTIRGITSSEASLPAGEVGEIGKRCLFSVAIYVDGLFGTDSAINPEKTPFPADLRSALTSFAQSGNVSSIPKLHNDLQSLQAAKLNALEDKAKTEKDNSKLRDRLQRKIVTAKRRKTTIRRFKNCLSKIESTFSETIALPSEKKHKIFALCDDCTPIHETIETDEKRHKSNCPACEAVMAVLKFTRSKEELRVNLLWELIAYTQNTDRSKEGLRMEEKLRNAHLDSALALQLCDSQIGEKIPAKPPKAYELLFRTLQEFQTPIAPKGFTRKPTQGSDTRFASIKEEELVPARAGGVKTAPQVKDAELGNFVVSFAGVDWCICAVMLKSQSQPGCDVVMVKTEKRDKGILKSTYCIVDAMVILESSLTAAKAWPVANTIYDFCAKHGPDLCKLPHGIRFKTLNDDGKLMYRNDVVTPRLAPCKIRAMGPHVRAACIGGTGEIEEWQTTFDTKRKRKTEEAQKPRAAPQLRNHNVVVHVIADEQ